MSTASSAVIDQYYLLLSGGGAELRALRAAAKILSKRLSTMALDEEELGAVKFCSVPCFDRKYFNSFVFYSLATSVCNF